MDRKSVWQSNLKKGAIGYDGKTAAASLGSSHSGFDKGNKAKQESVDMAAIHQGRKQ